jgi:hypothetical protein
MFERLPQQIQQIAEGAFQLFVQDAEHPSLCAHALDDTKRGRHRAGSVSVSITRRYRAIYVVDGGVNIWYWIGSHADYDNYTGN